MTSEFKERRVIELMISELNSLAYNGKSVGQSKEKNNNNQDALEIGQNPEEKEPIYLDKIIKSTSNEENKDSKDLEKKIKKTKDKDLDIKDLKIKSKTLSPEEDYARHTELYKKFHSEYMLSTQQKQQSYNFYSSEDTNKREFNWGDEIINYKERKEHVRKIQLNKLMQGDHNYVDPQEKEAYEHWKNLSKFNMLMSFHMYANVFNCG